MLIEKQKSGRHLITKVDIRLSDDTKKVLFNIGRTEDLRLSPSQNRLAIAGFLENKILLLEISYSPDKKFVEFTDHLELTHETFMSPHGLAWIDDERMVVANRDGGVSVIALPTGRPPSKKIEAVLLSSITSDDFDLLTSPGSVSVVSLGQGLYQVLVCNNYIHNISSHVLDEKEGFQPISNERMLSAELDIPDGVSVNAKATWLAVSNHSTHEVFLYENRGGLNEESRPDGRLRGVGAPHGLRFSSDGCHIMVADAGSPNVLVFKSKSGDWFGDFEPCNALQVIDDSNYALGDVSDVEGGPKGLELCSNRQLLFVTCEFTPLAVFDLEPSAITPSKLPDQFAQTAVSSYESDVARLVLARALASTNKRLQEVRGIPISKQFAYQTVLEAQILAIKNSISWRVTKPLRWLRKAARLRGLG